MGFDPAQVAGGYLPFPLRADQEEGPGFTTPARIS